MNGQRPSELQEFLIVCGAVLFVHVMAFAMVAGMIFLYESTH